MDTVSLEILPACRFCEAQAFYTMVGYFGAITDDCTVFVAEIDGAIIGVVRLAPENGVKVLRGMMIAEPYRRKGVGARMLQFIAPNMSGSDVYCLPHNWLEGFYGRAGFVRIDSSDAPMHLQNRLMEQGPKHPDLIIMARNRAFRQ